MKAKDLRIGNTIKHFDGIATVTGIKQKESGIATFITCEVEDRGNTYTCFKEEDGFDGIPLTTEWLVKFGWMWNKECKSFEKYPEGDVRCNMKESVLGSWTMFNYVLKATICSNIHYVHELQNLYYLLTRKELKP